MSGQNRTKRDKKAQDEMNFSEFAKKLYPFYGKDMKPADFIRALLLKSTKEESEYITELSDDTMNSYFKGQRNISKDTKKEILTKMDREKLDNLFLNEIPTEDALSELSDIFEPYLGVSTKDNISTKLSNAFYEIIRTGYISVRKNVFDDTSLTAIIDIELTRIIKTLSEIDWDDEKFELKYEPVKVDKKMKNDNAILKKEIRDNVINYYRYVESLFKEGCEIYSELFDKIAKKVNIAYQKLEIQNKTQQEIFDSLAKWLKEITFSSSDTACRIIISFFVQNCEVFREITE